MHLIAIPSCSDTVHHKFFVPDSDGGSKPFAWARIIDEDVQEYDSILARLASDSAVATHEACEMPAASPHWKTRLFSSGSMVLFEILNLPRGCRLRTFSRCGDRSDRWSRPDRSVPA